MDELQGVESKSEDIKKWFQLCGDCSCCKGYIFECNCEGTCCLCTALLEPDLEIEKLPVDNDDEMWVLHSYSSQVHVNISVSIFLS